MADEAPRAALERLCSARGENYAELSALIGRNPAYIHQFIRRGSPRRLDERDRRTLAAYFDVPEAVLGGPEPLAPAPAAFFAVPWLDVAASAGPGATGEAGAGDTQRLGFDRVWLRELASGSPDDLSIIRVTGDSMEPTLAEGDMILVDRGDAAARLRDGVYVLRRDDALIVKRIAPDPRGRLIAIRSDNPRYPSLDDCDPAAIEIIGRVVWTGRRVR